MDRGRLPLPTLLSCSLVAMTIGLDNELEQRMPHRTALGKKRGLPARGPWLVSWSVWANLLRFVPPEGIQLEDLRGCPGAGPGALGGRNPGVIRWGYVTLKGDVVRPTDALRRAAETIFPVLPQTVRSAWAHHLGAGTVSDLDQALGEVLASVDQLLPRYLPAADNLMWTRWTPTGSPGEPLADLELVDRLAQVLLLYALEHEKDSKVPLTMAANLLRVIDEEGTPARDLVTRAGISKEAMAYLTGWRQQPRLTVEPRAKTIGLTPEGRAARSEYEALPHAIERGWEKRFGVDVTRRLRSALEEVVADPRLERSPLADVVKAPESCWRSWVKAPATLPHFPMILHRGGYPDGG